jgi:hypothetical protein
MALFFAEQNAANMAFFAKRKMALFREVKNGEKLFFSRCEMRRKMVQFWAVSWVEPIFRDFFEKKILKKFFFSRSEMRRKNGALLLAKMAKNGAFQKKFERNKSAINGTFETKNRLPQSDAATRPDSHVLAPYQT